MTGDREEELRQRLVAACEALPEPEPARLRAIEHRLLARADKPRRRISWWLILALAGAGTAVAGYGLYRALSTPAIKVAQHRPINRSSTALTPGPVEHQAPYGASPKGHNNTRKQNDGSHGAVIYSR